MTFGSNDAMLKKWSAFCRKIGSNAIDYGTVLKTIQTFLLQPFTAAISDARLSGYWSASLRRWEREDEMN